MTSERLAAELKAAEEADVSKALAVNAAVAEAAAERRQR